MRHEHVHTRTEPFIAQHAEEGLSNNMNIINTLIQQGQHLSEGRLNIRNTFRYNSKQQQTWNITAL